MSYCLARRPDEFGLVPEAGGFVCLKHLARALSEEPGWGFVRESHLREAAYGESFEISEDGRIRAVAPELAADFLAAAAVPPTVLYLAARRKAYGAIIEHGLRAHDGRPVVLAASPEMALKIGRRRDSEPVMIKVRAAEAAGCSRARFGRAGELLYVAEAVPAQFMDGPPLEKIAMPRRRPQVAEPQPQELPGSFFPRLAAPAQGMEPPGSPRPKNKKRDGPEWKRERRRQMRRRHDNDQ